MKNKEDIADSKKKIKNEYYVCLKQLNFVDSYILCNKNNNLVFFFKTEKQNCIFKMII
jgi:hypothetical protein